MHARLEAKQDSQMIVTDEITSNLIRKLKDKKCNISWLTPFCVDTNRSPDAEGLSRLFSVLKRNKSLQALNLRRVFNAYEFNDREIKEYLLQKMSCLFSAAPNIVIWGLSENFFSAEEVQFLVDALNDEKVKQDPRITGLHFNSGNYDGARGVISLIKTQLDNPALKRISFKGSIPMEDLLQNSAPTAEAVALVKLYSDPRLTGKLVLDEKTITLMQKMQKQCEAVFNTSAIKKYRAPSLPPIDKKQANRHEFFAHPKLHAGKVKLIEIPKNVIPNRRYG